MQYLADQLLHIDRLAQMAVHARCKTCLFIGGRGVSGHCQNGQLGQVCVFTNPAGRLKAVHIRHLNIHND